MHKNRMTYLMYHELELPDRQTISNKNGYLKYVVKEFDFRRQLSQLRRIKFRGISVSEALDHKYGGASAVAITFDDGCETDILAAAPCLQEMEFKATFYVVVGHLGYRGKLSRSQARQLSELGFEIGCHSMTHAFLTDVNETQLHREIADAKDQLEQVIGRPIDHYSCPGGRWHPNVARMALESGYRSVATSRCATNSPATDQWKLGRVAVLRNTRLPEYERLCRGKGLLGVRAKNSSLAAAKALFGNKNYDKIRSAMMD
jgi:peptidoglycan/xylan/chitin deacetylase (PgdA/CDA1 family)